MRLRLFAAVAALAVPEAALAGPPFLTDDPEPTEAGHWGISALPFAGRPHLLQLRSRVCSPNRSKRPARWLRGTRTTCGI